MTYRFWLDVFRFSLLCCLLISSFALEEESRYCHSDIKPKWLLLVITKLRDYAQRTKMNCVSFVPGSSLGDGYEPKEPKKKKHDTKRI
jgi:hypothetical protein